MPEDQAASSDDGMQTSSGRTRRTQSQLGSGRVARNIRRVLLQGAQSEQQARAIRDLTKEQLAKRDAYREAGAASAISGAPSSSHESKSMSASQMHGDLMMKQRAKIWYASHIVGRMGEDFGLSR